MAQSRFYTSRWVPEGSTELQAPEAGAVCYFYMCGTRPSAIGYSGKRNKPDFHASFRTEKQRLDYANNWRQNLADTLRRKVEAKARNMQGHGIEPGAIFNFSWGWEQTNQDFYQVIAVTKCTVTVHEIQTRIVEGSMTGPMAGHVVAVPDTFLENKEPFTKRVQFTPDGRPYLSMVSYGWCDLWDGKPRYCSWYA